ncbi:MAG: biotin--[acetyl-CoA-carboxylase] ligase [Elusimicrobia bacterium]|nr:biotin--[acetyl-CoA-carboxylase] ligase [Candidatus Obscuribacterium magneticum]
MSISELLQYTESLPNQLDWLSVAKFFDRVDSTHTRVQQWLPKTGEGAALVVAESQTKGVGRQGRPWVSLPGGIWFTVAFPLKLSQLQTAPFSLVAALQIVNALKEVNNLNCQIKWPNDIVYEGKKLGGLLLSTVNKYRLVWLLIGVGINVNNPLSGELAKIATSIQQVRGQTQGRSRLMESILINLWSAWQDFDKTGFGPYKAAVESRLIGVGKSMKVLSGRKPMQGTFVGVDANGGLMLKNRSTLATIHAGEILP